MYIHLIIKYLRLSTLGTRRFIYITFWKLKDKTMIFHLLAFVEGLVVEGVTVLEHTLKRLQESQGIMRDFVVILIFFLVTSQFWEKCLIMCEPH